MTQQLGQARRWANLGMSSRGTSGVSGDRVVRANSPSMIVDSTIVWKRAHGGQRSVEATTDVTMVRECGPE